ncbi:MAG: ABC transporter permease [Clostridia bacterium]
MKKAICLVLAMLCCLGLVGSDILLESLEGQSVHRLSVAVNNGTRKALRDLSIEQNAEMGAFAVSETTFAGGALARYQCLAYHPGALGIVLTHGAPITQAQIERGDKVIMLSQHAAMQLSPDLRCVGTKTHIGEVPYLIIGIYRHVEPLNFLTRTSEDTAIVPITTADDERRVYVWLKDKAASPFAFAQADKALRELGSAVDLGDYQAIDLSRVSREGRQGFRLWLLIITTVLGLELLRVLTGSRKRFREDIRRAFAKHDAPRACLGLVWPFVRSMLPTLLVIGGWGVCVLDFAGRLVISDQVPGALLDPGAWIDKRVAYTMTANLAEGLPVVAPLLAEHLIRLGTALGIVALALWIIGFTTKKAGEHHA